MIETDDKQKVINQQIQIDKKVKQDTKLIIHRGAN